MLRWHRLCAVLALPLLAYVIVTGAGIQIWDLVALTTHAPETDPNMLMMRQHIDGPPNYAVVSAPDYTAQSLPRGLDYAGSIVKAARLGRQAAPGEPLKLVDVRKLRGMIAGYVQMGDRPLIFDLASGRPLLASDVPPPQPGRDFSSPRSDFKYFHRFNFLGQPATGLDGLAGVALALLVLTGALHYMRLYKMRSKMGRRSPFWRSSSWWRDLHRWVSLIALLPVLWLAGTGLVLSLDNVFPVLSRAVSARPTPRPGQPNGFDGDLSTPLRDGELPVMAQATLRAYRTQVPGTGIKVLHLRYFAGYAQGVVLAADAETTQHVFNTATGAAMSMHEKGYPDLGFPSGWEWHQRLKRLHRGDMFGLSGRWLDLLGAIGAIYLMLSGGVMYTQAWARRAKGGRREWIWT